MTVLSDLDRRLGDAVSTDPAELDAVRGDRSGYRGSGTPAALVRARTVDDVQAVLRIATATRTPVVPRGAGTGLAGGAIGTAGSIVLDVSAMDRVLEIDEADELAVVEPGIVTDALAAELAPYGLWWPPDPASRAISTVGGNIATNAGGLVCAKYGVTRESVLGLDVVLADGRLLRLGHRTVKGVTGYDLTALMIGSEGTLGVVVGATLKLRRIDPNPPVTIGATFATIVEAASASAAITAAGIRGAALELLDAASCEAIDALLAGRDGYPRLAGRGAFLLFRADGAGAEAEAARAFAIIEAHGGDARIADADEGEKLLEVRRSAHPAYAALGDVLIEDVAVPRSRLAEMFAAVERISAETGLPIPTIAHAGDGNLHPNLVVPPALQGEPGEIPEAVWRAGDLLFEAGMALGGTLTGEHGVGVLKRRWLERELGEDVLALTRAVKAAFDPLGILNPGKAI